MAQFKIVGRSENRNNFGLRGYILVDAKGNAYEAAHSETMAIHGCVWIAPDAKGKPNFASQSFEMPRKLKRMPRKLLAEIWECPEPPEAYDNLRTRAQLDLTSPRWKAYEEALCAKAR